MVWGVRNNHSGAQERSVTDVKSTSDVTIAFETLLSLPSSFLFWSLVLFTFILRTCSGVDPTPWSTPPRPPTRAFYPPSSSLLSSPRAHTHTHTHLFFFFHLQQTLTFPAPQPPIPSFPLNLNLNTSSPWPAPPPPHAVSSTASAIQARNPGPDFEESRR